jgi:hypothetical protein
MTRQLLTTLAVAALCTASGCTNSEPLAPASSVRPRFSQAPADGNGNKLVIPIDAQFPNFVTCNGGASLDMHVVGWVQVHVFGQPGNRNVELDGLYVVFTYSNAAGETFVWRELGPDHFYIDANGDLIHVITGHDGFDGVIGRFVVNTTTGEVLFVAGNQSGTRDDRACAALT